MTILIFTSICDEEAKAKQELGGPGDFEDAIKEIEKGKALIQQYYEQGILSAQEYERSLENVEKKIKNVQKAAYEARYDNSMKWIDDRNFYNDWKRGIMKLKLFDALLNTPMRPKKREF